MSADVSSIVWVLGRRKDEGEGKRELVTRDLLGDGGGGGGGSVAEMELERSVIACRERRLDFLSGRTYGRRSGLDPAHRQLQDLNLPPPSAALVEDPAALELNLLAPSADCRSVCTLEKVKSALERAERESRSKQRRSEGSSPSPPSSPTRTSSAKRRVEEGEEGTQGQDSWPGGFGGGMMAAGCPRCLLYVLISKGDPRCPRCHSHVPVPALKKRPRIDLNSAQD